MSASFSVVLKDNLTF